MKGNAYRNGRVHVCREMCSTCVFRPGNLMRLRAGRLREMVEDSVAAESAIICHKTLEEWPEGDGGNAVCRGFFDRYPTQPLQVADRLGMIEEVDVDA